MTDEGFKRQLVRMYEKALDMCYSFNCKGVYVSHLFTLVRNRPSFKYFCYLSQVHLEGKSSYVSSDLSLTLSLSLFLSVY